VTGIFRAIPVRASGMQQRTQKSIFKTYIDVIHFKKVDKQRLQTTEDGDTEGADNKRTLESRVDERDTLHRQEDELEKKIRALGAQPDIYDRLVEAMAPSIWELEDVKKGLLMQLFGGTHKEALRGGGGRQRGELNILLCGDPATSKSQLLSYVHKIR
jgi:DNA replication licensing factor MCM4